MNNPITRKSVEIWSQMVTLDSRRPEIDSEAELGKYLMNFFNVGDHYSYIFNVVDLKFDYMSPDLLKIVGYPPEEMTVPFFLSLIHPADQSYFLSFENESIRFLKTLPPEEIKHYKFRYDYRIKTKAGSYIRLLQQVIVIDHEPDGKLLRSFGVHTDITHLKSAGTSVFSIIGLSGRDSYYNIKSKEMLECPQVTFTVREKEVLEYIVKGFNSKDIAKQLGIGKETVNTYRKSLLEKTNAKNSAQLISYVIKQGIL